MRLGDSLLKALMDHREKVGQPHFIFSAENPKHPHKNELKMDHRQVLHHLKSSGYDSHEVNGHYGAPEKSIITYGVSSEQAEKLHGVASRLGQDSSIHSTGSKHEMRFHHGEDAGKKVHGEGTNWHKEKPADFYTTLPGGRDHFTHNFNFDKSEHKMGDYKDFKKSEKEDSEKLKATDKIPDSYKEEASKGYDVLFRVKIKGKSELTDGIPLHMSLKIFKDPKEFDIEKLKKIIKDNDIVAPNNQDLEFKPTIFTSERNGQEYHMLVIIGLDDRYGKLYREYKDVGITYRKFMPHITINKEIYDDIVANGIKADDVEFGELLIEAGPENTICSFSKSQDLEKGIKQGALAIGLAGALMAPNAAKAPDLKNPKPANTYSSQRMLRTIASVESNSGKQQNHKQIDHGVNRGDSAYGKYGLTPNVIRETVNMNSGLKSKYGKVSKLNGKDLQHYMQDNPKLEDEVAENHLKRLEHHFGQDPEKIGYSWLNGVQGGYNAKKKGIDVKNHWHTKKIRAAYDKDE